MIIRNDQLSLMGELLFVQRFRSVLHDSLEDTPVLPSKELDAAILEQLKKAKRYGLLSEQPTAAFVMTAWLLGPSFEVSFPAVKERLKDPNLSEVEKAVWLESFTVGILNMLEETE